MTKLRTAIAHGEALQAFSVTLESLFAGPPIPPEPPRVTAGARRPPRTSRNR